ncbi:MAG TPA: hypothetical protein VJK72_05545 [Candidatus Nanoarchaeia archaeon]|nr:hypothetical protein [Candidatus Nanoarchaeia archaeon]
MKKTLLAITLALSACAAPQKNNLNVLPAYNVKNEHATIRIEGSSEPVKRLKLYSFADIDATKEKPIDFENWYGEVRLGYSLGDVAKALEGLSAIAEYNGGNGLEDTVRFGPQWSSSLWKGNFISAKFFPFDIANKEMQAGLFVSQGIGKVTTSLLGEYNFEPKTLYSEAEFAVKLTDRISAVAQARAFIPAKASDTEIAPIVGVRYGF